MNKEKVDGRLIRNYTKGQYSFQDLKRLAHWFGDLSYHNEIKAVIDEHWAEFELDDGMGEKDLSAVYNRLRLKIIAEKKEISLTQKVYKIYIRVAAILIMPLIIYSAFSLSNHFFDFPKSNPWVEIVSPKGARTHFELPDGTKVSLNSGTHLFYHVNFKNDREVKLEGEAYFDVVHNQVVPFEVQTDFITVRDIGTKFSVSSFAQEKTIEVILQEGEVELMGEKGSFRQELKPNEGFYYDKETHSGKIATVDAVNLTAWKDGLLVFRSEPLGEVLKRLGRWYNVRFDIQDKEIEDLHYRATFREEPLEEVMRLISLTASIKYEIRERKVDENGEYQERVVVVRKKL